MKKTTIYIVLALLCPFLNSSAQVTQAISIGQEVPDVPITNILNYPGGKASLHSFKGKLLILDFWATWCMPCVAMIPKADSLQKAFSASVQFLPVAYQPAAVVGPFLAKLHTKPSALPQVVGDKILNSLFPHTTLPHYVWISPESKVLAITSYEDITAEKIRAALAGNGAALTTKLEMAPVVYDPAKPLFARFNGGDAATLKYQRLIAGYTEGLNPGYKFSSDSMGTKITARNASLLDLYSLAWGEGRQFLNSNRVILEVANPAAFSSSAKGNDYLAWMRSGRVFCYELIGGFPSNVAFSLMRDDLSLYFGNYTATVERRTMPCLVLALTGQSIPPSKGGTPAIKMTNGSASLQNARLSHFVGRLDSYHLQKSKLPLIDETGITYPIDLDIEANLTDPARIDQALAPYGLSLNPALRETEVLVIHEKLKPTN